MATTFRAALGLLLPALALSACNDLAGLAAAPSPAAETEELAGKKQPVITPIKPAAVTALQDYLKSLAPTIGVDDAKVTQTADTWVLEQTYHIKDYDAANLKLDWKVTGGGTWQTGTPPAAPADATYKFNGAWVKVDQSDKLAPKITITVPHKTGVISSGNADIMLTATNSRGKGSKLAYSYSVSYLANNGYGAGWGGGVTPVDESTPTLPPNVRLDIPLPSSSVADFLNNLAPTITPTNYQATDAATAFTQAETYVVKDLNPAGLKLDWQVTGTNTWKTGTPPAAPADATHKLTGCWAKLDTSTALSPRLTFTFPHQQNVVANGSAHVVLTATNAKGKATKLDYTYFNNFDGTRMGAYGGGGEIGPVP